MENCRPLTPEEIQIYLPLMILGIAVLFSPLLYLGYRTLIKTENTLAFVRGLSEKQYRGLGMEPPTEKLDSYHEFNYALYKIIGFCFFAMYICTMLVLIYITWDTIVNGGTVYIGCGANN